MSSAIIHTDGRAESTSDTLAHDPASWRDRTSRDQLCSNRRPPAAGPVKIRNPRVKADRATIRNLLWCLPFLLAGLCFWQALPTNQHPAQSRASASIPAPVVSKTTGKRQRTLVTRPIQDIQVGQRVLAENPELRGAEIPQATIDPQNSRLVVLHQVKPDGHELTVETLFSLEDLGFAAIEHLESGLDNAIMPRPFVGTTEDVLPNELLVGHVINLNIAELGAEGPAEIVAVHPCPPIEPDDGTGRRLVTSVFRHSAANVVDVSTTGSDESIGATSNHPFWSEDRQAFIPASDLRPGENLRPADGTLVQVTRITPRRGPPVPVFNFEVDGQHVYSVGADGVLVHNAGCGGADPVKAGLAAESHLGITTTGKTIIDVGLRKRIPDLLTDRVLLDAKYVQSLSLTAQIKDFMDFARANELQFILVVRQGTKISGPLLAKEAEGLVTIIRAFH